MIVQLIATSFMPYVCVSQGVSKSDAGGWSVKAPKCFELVVQVPVCELQHPRGIGI